MTTVNYKTEQSDCERHPEQSFSMTTNKQQWWSSGECPYCVMVVNLSIVAEPQERKLLDAQGLHAIQLVHDGQPVEAETAVGEAVDVLKTKGIGAPVSDLHGVGALD